MSTETDYDNGTLVVTRTYGAPIEAVFDAWIQTSKVQQWFGSADTVNVSSTINPKVGGDYTHEMTLRTAHGDHVVPGVSVFTEYDPPSLLAYAPPRAEAMEQGEGADMSVRVEFTAVSDNQTEVRLTHTGIPDEFSPFIIDGWGAAFGKLYRFLVTEAHAA